MSKIRQLDGDVVAGGVGLLLALVLVGASMQIPPPPSKTSVIGPNVFPYAVSVLLAAASIVLLARGLLRSRSALAQATSPHEQPSEDGSARAGEDDSAAPSKGGSGPDGAAGVAMAEPEVTSATGSRRLQRLVVVAAMLLVYILIFIPMGYLVSTFLFLAGVTTYMDRRRWVRNLVYAVAFPVVVYFSFTMALNVQLPPGVLG